LRIWRFFSIRKQAGLNVTLGEQSMDFSRYDGWAVLNVTLGEQSMDFSRYDGWAVLNVTLGEQSMEWFRGFFVTLIFVGSLQPAARPTDPTEH
jgi:hypothetical protein